MNKINTDVNYRTMAGNARLVMLGESSHNPAIYKYEAIKALKQLKAAGFTHFAIEMLPRSMQEKIEFYQRTGKGFNQIQQYFNENWAWGYLVPKAYGELVKVARDIGLKIVALDVTPELMEEMDKACSYSQYTTGKCKSTHSVRNENWAGLIANILSYSKEHRVIAFMHRWHAIKASEYELGIDTIIKTLGVNHIRYIDFIGGIACLTERDCKGYSDEASSLKKLYFFRRGLPFKSAVQSYQVHIPESGLMRDGSL